MMGYVATLSRSLLRAVSSCAGKLQVNFTSDNDDFINLKHNIISGTRGRHTHWFDKKYINSMPSSATSPNA